MREGLVLGLALILATASCTLAVRTGPRTLNEPAMEEVDGASGFEVLDFEAVVTEQENVHFDASLGFTYTHDAFEVDLIDFSANMHDYRVSSHYYPFKQHRFTPYLGGGLSYFRLYEPEETTTLSNCSGFVNPFSGGYKICEKRTRTDTVTIAAGYYTHAMLGVNIEASDLVDFVVEKRFEFEKKDEGFDLSGDLLLVGLRWKFDI